MNKLNLNCKTVFFLGGGQTVFSGRERMEMLSEKH